MLRRSLAVLVAAATPAALSLMAGAGAAHAAESDLRTPESKIGAATAPEAKARIANPSRRALRAARATPLLVAIDTLIPSEIPQKGRIRLAGTVTNTDTVPWLAVNVYSFISEEPMTTQAELADAVEVEESQSIGRRVVDPGNFFTIDEIAPGESEPFSFTVDVDLLDLSVPNTPGVYWFGVHALGDRNGEGRDELADGRARTFIPLVPPKRAGREAISIVIPMRRQISYADDGSLDDLLRWTTTLDEGGRLRSLLEFAVTSGSRTVNWVVDPALIDAVRQLAAGNPPRSIAANLEEGAEPAPADGGPSESPSDGTAPDDQPGDEPTDGETGADPVTAELPDDLDPATRAAAEAAREWLGRLKAAMVADDEIYVLPYGDIDVSAAARHRREDLLERARERSAGPLPGIDLPTTPVVAPPSGYLSPAGIRATTPDETVIVGDRLFPRPPAVASVSGRRLVVTSIDGARGGPGPGDRRGAIAMRQRILSEAAIRFLKPARAPLVVLLPYDWIPPASTTFFTGFDLAWVDLASVAQATGSLEGVVEDPEDLKYPQRQTGFELDNANFAAAQALLDRGESLDRVLTLNDRVGGAVSDQALASTSYAARAKPDSSRASTDRSRLWIEDRLSEVEVSAPGAVTLSSINGSFPTEITNRLDEPVTVSLAAESDDQKLVISAPAEIEIAARSTKSVLLDARTETPGVHDVTILVTDSEGNAIGGSDQFSVRSARVSNAIWLFLAGGIGLLFGTIGVRLVRRVRAARHE